jgi:hypothetical protein
MDPSEATALTAKLGAVLHERAHRSGLGGAGIDCLEDVAGPHAPCYLIAAEIAESLPSTITEPSQIWREGWREGTFEVVNDVLSWLGSADTEGPGQLAYRQRIAARMIEVRRRIRVGDADWRRR